MALTFDTSTMARAAVFQLATKFAHVVLQLGTNMVLARLLAPSDFGIVAVLLFFTGLFGIMSDAGISSAIVQFKELDRRDYRYLLTFFILLGAALAALFCLVCYGVAVVSERTVFSRLGFVLSFAVIFNSVNMVPNGILLRRKRFDIIGIRLVTCSLVVGMLTIALALMGGGVFTLALNSVMTSLFVLTWNLVGLKLTPVLGDFRPSLNKVWRYSAFQFGHETAGYLARNVDNLLIGGMLGVNSLGYYSRAYSLSTYPLTYLIGSITSTLRTFFAESQHLPDLMYSSLLKVAKSVSLLAAFLTCVFSVAANDLVVGVFGRQWETAGPLLQVLAVTIYCQSMNGVLAPVMGARGKTSYLMLSTVVNSLVTILLIIGAAMTGKLLLVCVMVAVAYYLEMIAPLYLGIRVCLGRSIWKYIRTFVPEVLAGGSVVVSGFMFDLDYGALSVNLLLRLLWSSGVYLAICVVLGQGQYMLGAIRRLRH